jgi:predicted alpha/beta superfamily hydrolase
MKSRLLFLTLLLSLFVKAFPQDGYTESHDSLKSAILGQTRNLSIFLPAGYENGKGNYPVLYVLDADGRDQHVVPTARFLFNNRKMPQVIIVGVFNIDRNHDFLPDSTKDVTTGGGADNFLKFFKDELIPWVDKKFRSNGNRVLIGHSFGGVFTMHVLLNDPDLFSSYIAIDPSFWYKNKMQVRSAVTQLGEQKNWKKTIYISGRDNGGMKDMGIDAMERALKSSAPKDLRWKIVAYDNEDHGSVTFKSVYDGLRFIFDSGSSFNVYPQTGIVPEGYKTKVFISNFTKGLRYTTDGREPGLESPLCKAVFEIGGGNTLKVRYVTDKFANSLSVTRTYQKGAFLTGEQNIGEVKPGLRYSYYEGVWDSVPDLDKYTPKHHGITENLDLNFILRKDSIAVRYEGYLKITEKNLYYLWVVSDDGSKVYLNNKLLLNNDGLHSADEPVVTAIPLEPGYYPLRIDYFEKNGGESISLGWIPDLKKIEPKPVPKEMFFYKE